MKARTFLLWLIITILFGGILFAFAAQNQKSVNTYPATVTRDCAPWDGGAFTVSVQYDPATTIIISIWESPNIPQHSKFTFPDDSGQVGNVSIRQAGDSFIELNGEVVFERVSQDAPLEGRFIFTSARGEAFEGHFVAEWEDQIVLCG